MELRARILDNSTLKQLKLSEIRVFKLFSLRLFANVGR